MTLLEEADEKVVIVSPYCKIEKWFKLKRRLTELRERNISLEFYVRSGEIETINQIRQIGIQPIEIPNLHCKLYMNENNGVVSSMNLLLSSEINSLEIGYLTETESEYNDLFNFYKRYILKHKASLSFVENSDINFQEYLHESISGFSDRRISIFYDQGSIRINTGRNNYQSFIYNQRGNFLRINGILSQKELEFANYNIILLRKNINLKVDLQKGQNGYYDLVWGTSPNKLKSQSLNKICKEEKIEIANSIINFVQEIEELKKNCH